jgi:multicomponent Na+:H+ antiporter subunit D
MLAFFLLAVGFGVKAGIMPLHQWLPEAMVAPTPVSGLLHAVAVVKSGAFGVSRVVLDVFGPELVFDLSLPFGFSAGLVLSTVGAITLTAASLIALRKDHLKQRLAYSTVSQLSYIVLGLGLFGWYGLVGALLHIPAHAFMKLTLFFCAGNLHVSTHTDYISEMAGIGKRMPLTMGAFTVASLGMAGIPLVAGFVSKYYMLLGGIRMGAALTPVAYYLVGALLLSGVLNIAYFWPVIYTAFFEAEDDHDAKPLVDFRMGGASRSTVSADTSHAGDDVALAGRHADGDVAPDGGRDADESDEESVDAPTDETGVVRPDFTPADRDFSEPAPRVDTGEYAVDRSPSDADVQFGVGRGEAVEDTTRDERSSDHDGDDAGGESHGTDEGHGSDHHGGPPAGGWRHIHGLDVFRGRESSWFTLGPILTAMSLAVLLGVIPYELGFLELIELVVDTRLPAEVFRP